MTDTQPQPGYPWDLSGDSRFDDQNRRLCQANTSNGSLCRAPAMHGQTICRSHGGATAANRAAGHRRYLEALAGPAVEQLRVLIQADDTPPAVRLGAIRTVLDRAGLVAPQRVEVITEDLLDREIARLEAELADED